MQKHPPDDQTIYQFQNSPSQQASQYLSPEASIQKSKKQYFYFKLNLSILLVLMATISVQTQMQYYGPFVRTVQNFFNYHMLEHTSEDIYESNDVIFWRTQEYNMGPDIMGFFDRFVYTFEIFRTDSFFYADKQTSDEDYGSEIVKILIVSEIEDDANNNEQNKFQTGKQTYMSKLMKEINIEPQYFTTDKTFRTTHQQIWILQRPINKLRQFFNLTVYNKQFYRKNLKKVEFETSLNIKFKDHQNCTISVITSCTFASAMMMTVKVDVKVLDYEEEVELKSSGNEQGQSKQFNDNNLGIRKLSQFHNLNFDFKHMMYAIFVVNCILFCIELMVIIRINEKIDQNLKQQRQLENRVQFLIHLQKIKNSPKPLSINSRIQISQDSFLSSQSSKSSINLLNQLPTAVKQLSYKQRIQMIGLYNILELTLSFLVLITVNEKGLVCLWCWTKLSIYLSETGNRMMIGFLFKQALPAYLKIIFNLLIWLSGFVFFSMAMYKYTMKFETVQLAYYEYFFNYFQYGIYENFMPIERYGPMYSFLYFIHMAFLVMVGNNIMQSILARQVLKNSNMKSLVEFIEGIQVECPICGCPPEIKKKINIKMDKKTQRENRFISQYFQAKKQASNKSKYEIEILSPEFSPMFHKSQYKNKQFKLRKISGKNNELLSPQMLIANSPPMSPLALSPELSPLNRALQPQAPQKKKVKIQIGGDMNHKKVSKFQQYAKNIKTKSQVINKILHQMPKQHEQINSVITKRVHEQFLKKKLQQIKLFMDRIR